MHLIFLIHGLFGNPSHMLSMEESILGSLSKAGKDVVVHRAQCMSAVGTFDGVAVNAHKLFSELMQQVEDHGATHLSIVGYSMGGLCGRYLIGLLEEAGAFSKLKPVVFATFATPHLGSKYPFNTLYGHIFNFVGSRITGYSGFDLFRRTPLINDLADRKSVYYRGLARFKHLYLFANTAMDRTVPFWTSYIAPKNPFADPSRLDLRLYSSAVYLVDMENSKVTAHKVNSVHNRLSFGRTALNLFFKLVIPMFLVLLVGVMCIISLMSWIRRWRTTIQDTLYPPQPKNRGKSFVSGVGAALEETLDIAGTNISTSDSRDAAAFYEDGPVPDSHGLPSPGYQGLVDSMKTNLDLPPQQLANIEALNELPWRKYAVRLTMMHTHGQIVDRRGKSPEGKALVDFFGIIMARRHNENYSA